MGLRLAATKVRTGVSASRFEIGCDMLRVAFACLAVVACTPGPPAPVWHPRAGTIVPSMDPVHPTKIEHHYHEPYTRRGELELDTPTAGDWWFAFDTESAPKTSYDVAFYVTGVMNGKATVHDVTSDVAISPVGSGPAFNDTWKAEVRKLEQPRRWLLHVTTSRAERFSVSISLTWSTIREPEPPPPAPHPPCDPIHPDYVNNPGCCYITGCALQRGHCEAKVVKLLWDRKTFEIDRGSDRGVMVGAIVRVAEGGWGTVSTVWPAYSIVEIESSGDKIAPGRTAYLSTPKACFRR